MIVYLLFVAYTLQLVVDKTKPSSLWNEKKIILREPLNDDISGKELATLWKIVDSYPTDRDFQAIMLDMEPQQRVAYARGLQPSQVQFNILNLSHAIVLVYWLEQEF